MPILVTGATGNVGRHVVEQLVQAGAQVRAVTRNPARVSFPDGVEAFAGDLAKPASLAGAFAGVTRMFLFPLAYRAPVVRSMADVMENPALAEVAARAGVRRQVMLGSSDSLFDVERAVEAWSPEWTVLRPGEFAVNKLDQWAPSIRASGVVRAAYGDSWGTPIHEADIAAVAVAALLEDGHRGRRYELTGPQALTLREQVRAIGEGIGREIRFEELTHAQARAELLALGTPVEVVDLMILAQPARSAPPVLPTVREVTGRPGRTLVQWAAEHADDFRP